LQHPHYYQNISELSYDPTATTDLTLPSTSLKETSLLNEIKVEPQKEQKNLKEEED
jgi:hypothetical protein